MAHRLFDAFAACSIISSFGSSPSPDRNWGKAAKLHAGCPFCWKLTPWTRAGWSGRSHRSKACWRWRRQWRRRSLGEVEKGPLGVTGDLVAISGTRVRHVPLKSNVHSTVQLLSEWQAVLLQQPDSSTIWKGSRFCPCSQIFWCWKSLLGHLNLKGFFERIPSALQAMLCASSSAFLTRSYRSIAPPKERRRMGRSCFAFNSNCTRNHSNELPTTGGRAQLELWIGLGWMLCIPWYQWGFLESEKVQKVKVIRPVWSLERNQHVMVQLSQLIFWKSIFSHWPC